MDTVIFYSSIYTILLVVIHISKNKTEKADGFAVTFDGNSWNIARPDGKQFWNLIILCMVEVWLLPVMFEPVCFCCFCYFKLQGWKSKKYFQIFVQIMWSLESNNCNVPQMTQNQKNLLMNVVNQYGEKQNGFAEIAAFCHMTCRHFDRFLLQGVGAKPAFSIWHWDNNYVRDIGNLILDGQFLALQTLWKGCFIKSLQEDLDYVWFYQY